MPLSVAIDGDGVIVTHGKYEVKLKPHGDGIVIINRSQKTSLFYTHKKERDRLLASNAEEPVCDWQTFEPMMRG